MHHYPIHSPASKITLSEEEDYFPIDSARFYLENSICYEHARAMQDDNNPLFYDFVIGYYTRYTNKMTMDDVNNVYVRIKDSLANYFETIDADKKQLSDVIVQFEYSGTGVKFNIHATFSTLYRDYPFFDDPNNITFQNYFSDGPYWHWEYPITQTIQTTPWVQGNPQVTAFHQFMKFFYQRTQAAVMPPYTNQYLWVKDPIARGVNQITNSIILVGPTSEYIFPTPVGFPSSTEILHTCFFMAGSNNFNSDPVLEKTWLSATMLDFYLKNIIILENNRAQSDITLVGKVPWQLTPSIYAPSMGSYVNQFNNPSYPMQGSNYLNLNWRMWVFGIYFAYKTTIVLPAPTPL